MSGNCREGDRPIGPRSLFVLLVAITAIAAGLRLYQLDTGSFWVDEIWTLNTVAHLENAQTSKVLGYLPTWAGLHMQGVDPGLLEPSEEHRWRALGVDEQAARLPTAVVGIITVPLVTLAACMMLGVRAGLMVGLLLALAPWHIYWSQAARFYIPQFMFYTLCLVLYFVATRAENARRFRALFTLAMVCLVLAFMSQPTALVIVGVFAIDWLAQRLHGQPVRLGAFGWGAATVALGLCTAMLLYDVVNAPQRWTHFVAEPQRHQEPLRMMIAAAYMIGPGVGIAALLTIVGLKKDRRMAMYLAVAGILPVLLFAGLSAFAFVGLRYAFGSLFGWLALVAVGLAYLEDALRPTVGPVMAKMPAALVIVSVLFMNVIYFRSHGNFHARWRDAAELVMERRSAGETIYASDPVITSFYMGERVVALPDSPAELRQIDAPAWFIVETSQATAHTSRHWLFDVVEAAELVDYYPLRSIHSDTSVQVYRYPVQR